MIVNDATPEALAAILADVPRGLLIYKDEFLGLVKSIDAYARQGIGKGKEDFLELYDGGSRIIDRKGNGADPFVSITGRLRC